MIEVRGSARARSTFRALLTGGLALLAPGRAGAEDAAPPPMEPPAARAPEATGDGAVPDPTAMQPIEVEVRGRRSPKARLALTGSLGSPGGASSPKGSYANAASPMAASASEGAVSQRGRRDQNPSEAAEGVVLGFANGNRLPLEPGLGIVHSFPESPDPFCASKTKRGQGFVFNQAA